MAKKPLKVKLYHFGKHDNYQWLVVKAPCQEKAWDKFIDYMDADRCEGESKEDFSLRIGNEYTITLVRPI